MSIKSPWPLVQDIVFISRTEELESKKVCVEVSNYQSFSRLPYIVQHGFCGLSIEGCMGMEAAKKTQSNLFILSGILIVLGHDDLRFISRKREVLPLLFQSSRHC